MNTVAMRLLPLDRTGLIKLPPARERNSTGIDPSCTPGARTNAASTAGTGQHCCS